MLRLGKKSDIEEMMKLRTELFTDGQYIPGDEDLSSFRHFYENLWDEKNAIYVVAEREDKKGLIGQAAVSITAGVPSARNPTGMAGLIWDVCVHEEYRLHRGQGFGKKIFRELLRQCKEHNIGYLFLTASKKGEPLYRSLGFSDVHLGEAALEFWQKDYEILFGNDIN